MYHQNFWDGADTEHVHGNSHLHGGACNRKYPESRTWKPNQTCALGLPACCPARLARARAGAGDGHTTLISPIYHLDLGQRADAQHVHCDSHLHGRACKRITILTPTRIPRPPSARVRERACAVKALWNVFCMLVPFWPQTGSWCSTRTLWLPLPRADLKCHPYHMCICHPFPFSLISASFALGIMFLLFTANYYSLCAVNVQNITLLVSLLDYHKYYCTPSSIGISKVPFPSPSCIM